MKENLKGKKLLVFGGNALACDLVNAARKKGVYTIVTDWCDAKHSAAKLICDEAWDVSILDYNELVSRIKNNNIDGIITGFADSYLLPYQKLCEMTGKPCYATKEQFEWTMDKRRFKEKCKLYGVPIVPEYNIESFDRSKIDDKHKVIIKPVDNSGSRGICVCDNADDFESKLDYSLQYSEKKQVIIEKYMDCDDVSFEYKIQEGEITLSAICDRFIYKTPYEGSVTSSLIYPSKYTESFLRTVDQKVKNMFESEGIRNGVLFMQAFADENGFYFYEMGYRLSGGRHYIFTKNQNGESAVEELVEFALNGRMSDRRIALQANPYFKSVCSQMSIICKSERIEKIEGWDSITKMQQIIDASSMYSVGDIVGKQGTTASIFARLHIVVNSIEELSDIKSIVYSRLAVKNECGDNIIIQC